MNDLSQGGDANLPDGWAYPSPVYVNGEYISGGIVWRMKTPATGRDIAALKLSEGDGVTIDQGTLMGFYKPFYSAYGYRVQGKQDPAGGYGSENYEQQLIGENNNGVEFATDPIWYYTSDGEYVKGIPPNLGAFHKKHVGDNYYNLIEGPEPGSVADQMLDGGRYTWNETHKWYEIL